MGCQPVSSGSQMLLYISAVNPDGVQFFSFLFIGRHANSPCDCSEIDLRCTLGCILMSWRGSCLSTNSLRTPSSSCHLKPASISDVWNIKMLYKWDGFWSYNPNIGLVYLSCLWGTAFTLPLSVSLSPFSLSDSHVSVNKAAGVSILILPWSLCGCLPFDWGLC